ncbi:MAG: YhbY family RNA-binding protein [Oscillospiraceae bacterium]
MINSKQRAELKSIANSLEPVFQIGKSGVNDAQVAQINDYLRVHEIVKIKVLENSLYSAKEAAAEISEKIGADVVQVIGSKAILFKRNPQEHVLELKTMGKKRSKK